jgi:serine/threonine protein kinase/tetratricopeptide (TPR) repeat protein
MYVEPPLERSLASPIKPSHFAVPMGASSPDFLGSVQAALGDRYRLERELGRGGMAIVYLARDPKHDRLVALKLLRHELGAALGPERFLREIAVTAGLQHPHILPLLDSGTLQAGGSPYYVMPYVQGESLRDRLERERELPIEQALHITLDVAAALGYAHEHGVVHRDIKPENILLSGGQAVVADFGIARALSAAGAERLTETGLTLGTPHYMSPEQAAGDPRVDGRADIYALGCVLYEMLAGEPPYTGPTAQAIIAKRMLEPAPRVRTVRESVPQELEHAIIRALARTPADRFGTAQEFADALSPARDRTLVPRSGGRGRLWRAAGILVAVLAAAGLVLRLWSGRSRAGVSPSASRIAVMPFTPSGSDTGLSRLGRDLVFTLSAELDGLGAIRVVDAHTVLAHSKQDGLSSPGEEAVLARRFGAGSVVHGSLVREGADVRLDFVLRSTDSSATPLARASVSGASDSVAALTDSAVHVLLRQIWTRGSAPTPSLEAALKTRSVPALRAFLEGERQIVGGRWDSASASYGRAREADPAFWLAYARQHYAMHWSVRPPLEMLSEALQRHRFELPESERLLAEAIMLWSRDSVALALDRARQLTERDPNSWFGWLNYADQLMHNGPLLGRSRAEARAGFQRALELNPNLIPVHEHLMLLALEDRDTAAAARGLRELTRLDAGPSLMADGYGNRMLQFRFLAAIERGDSLLTRVLADSIAQDPEPEAVPDGSFYDAYRYGLPAEQIEVSGKVVQSGARPARRATHGRLLALSWVQRGAWDSALVAMDRLVASETDSAAALESYGLAVVGAWLGAVGQREAEGRRQAAVTLAGANDTDRAEVAWLDGLAAAGRRDRRALAEARAALGPSGDASSDALDRSLAAFEDALTGNPRAAGRSMADLESQEAALSAPDFTGHPYTIAVDRLAAGRWLAASGESERALRLLTWVDGAYFIHPSTVYSLVLMPLVDLERGRIEEKKGRRGPALNYYREFLRRYDRPIIGHRGLVEEARTAVGRLTDSSE